MHRSSNGTHSLRVNASSVSPRSASSPINGNGHQTAVRGAASEDDGLHEVALELGDADVTTDSAPNLSNMESIPQSRRVSIEIQGLSAYVPDIFAKKPNLWQRLKPSSLRRKVAQSTPSSRPENQILFNISGCVKPGEVLALMGPSGSGKTTLLSIMGGRQQRSMRVTGQVLFNGQPLTKSMKRKIGYVMQDDLLYESLTVYETLYYAAMLRLPRDMTKEEKLDRVNAVISSLGLQKCKDTIIGGFFRRGISGGERKRASVGHELLINPSTLFLDEPTSGLDSTTAMHLLETLRMLAQGGRAVVTTIHQPSSRLYQQLDKLLLLSGGHALYYGDAQQSVDYFERVGYPIPPRVNAADFILDLASGEVSSKTRNGETSRRHLVALTEAFLVDRPLDGFNPSQDPLGFDVLEGLAHRGSSPSLHKREMGANLPVIYSGKDLTLMEIDQNRGRLSVEGSSGSDALPSAAAVAALGGRVDSGELPNGNYRFNPYQSQYTGMDISAEVDARPLGGAARGGAGGADAELLAEEHRWGAPFWSQVFLLFQRSLRTRRFETLSTQDLCQFIIIAVLAGLFWLQKGQDNTVAGSRDVLGVLFFMLMFLSFRSLFVSLFTFPQEQRHMLKERASGLYRLSAFYLARLLSDFPMDLTIPTGFIIIVYFMVGLRYNAAAFFAMYGTLLLSMFVAQSLGLLLGSYLMNPKTAQTVAAVLMLTIVLTGGFFVQNIPAWIAWIKWLSYIYYALGIMLYIQYDGGNTVVYSCFNGTAGTAATTEAGMAEQCTQTNPSNPETDPHCYPVENLQQTLGLLQNPASGSDALRNGFVLLGFLIVLRVSVYYVLRRKTSGF
jgi:ABC-type multidrug transport system ATPase subunit